MATKDTSDIRVLSIGHANEVFKENTIERKRLTQCAERMHSLHTVILGAPKGESHEGKLFLYGVGGSWRWMKLVYACLLAFCICRTDKNGKWVFTSQDPFESALIGYIVSRFYGKYLVIQEHGDFFSTSHWSRESTLNRLRFFMGLFLLRRAWRVRVVSERIKATLVKKGIQMDRIIVLPVVTDIAAFKKAESLDSVRALFPSNSIIVLAASRFVQQKNISLLLHAFHKISKTHDNARLLLVGAGVQHSMLLETIKNHDLSEKIVVQPWTDSFPRLLKSVDIFVLTSNYEGWGRVLVESIAAGTPVVTTDVGCVGEVFKDNVHGLVVHVGDLEGFAKALDLLVEDSNLRSRLGNSTTGGIVSKSVTPQEYATEWASVLAP